MRLLLLAKSLLATFNATVEPTLPPAPTYCYFHDWFIFRFNCYNRFILNFLLTIMNLDDENMKKGF